MMVDFRDPEAFGMYTFNDHAGYGALEVVQNALMWAVCEALGWLIAGDWVGVMRMIDDGEILDKTRTMYEYMLLAMLAELDKQGQLGPNSDVRNLGFIMAMYADESMSNRSQYKFPASRARRDGSYYGEDFVLCLVAYAARRNITMHGPPDIDETIARAEEETEQEDIVLPTRNKDPWDWVPSMKMYERRNSLVAYGGIPKVKIGGDALDITTFSSAERKRKSFNGTDPLTPNMIKSLKAGLLFGSE
ncbi:uncharacterized protein BO80DRAFT_498173 [Aspergillus ibericus CBS 121593]|uniref:Uncharacterized protein n=1 Tax=Aspergillus ibericus CBS 121593 TaxID=1448316 RepID=A0A395GHY3_9EURO|nr:hypothetical protein BO80DRAFT_498173 [Aspergillus ibericus CBS 121593]RAK94842.1 hypothetical protein BO80DRAFT_498173 [Aspergillus ibericus CBS 121593]